RDMAALHADRGAALVRLHGEMRALDHRCEERRLHGEMLHVLDLGIDRDGAEILLHHRVRPFCRPAIVNLDLRVGPQIEALAAARERHMCRAERPDDTGIGDHHAALQRLPLMVDQLQDRATQLHGRPIIRQRRRTAQHQAADRGKGAKIPHPVPACCRPPDEFTNDAAGTLTRHILLSPYYHLIILRRLWSVSGNPSNVHFPLSRHAPRWHERPASKRGGAGIGDGQMRIGVTPWVRALLLAPAFASLPAIAHADETRPLKGVALVIGESDYAGLQKLDNPRRDARAMDDMLDSLGFSVDRLINGDARKLRQEMDDFIDEAKGADVALVYYSGHGIEAGGSDFLVPVDADLSSPETAGQSLVPVSDMLERLAKTVPVTIALLDACRTNSFPAGQLVVLPGSTQAVSVAPAGLEAMRGPTPVATAAARPDSLGMVIGFAASPGQPAMDGEPGGNSPYAAALLEHFAAGGYSVGDLMTLVSEEVYLKTKARQLPWTNS